MFNRKDLMVICASAIAAGFSLSIHAFSGGGMSFSSLDADGDNKVSQQEFINNAPMPKSRRESIFNKLDINNDGYLSQQEVNDRPERESWGNR